MDNIEFKQLVRSAIDKLIEQGVPSKNKAGECFYLSEESSCCIVGHMMTDDKTRKKADNCENSGIQSLFRNNFPWAKQFEKYQIQFMGRLQSVHDDIFTETITQDDINAFEELYNELG